MIKPIDNGIGNNKWETRVKKKLDEIIEWINAQEKKTEAAFKIIKRMNRG